MNVTIDPDMPGLAEAVAAMDQLEADQSASAAAAQAESSAPKETPSAPSPGTDLNAQPLAAPKLDTPAATEQSQPKQPAKAGDLNAQPSESAYSKAQKNAQRRDNSWKALEAAKDEFVREQATAREQLQKERLALQQERETFQRESKEYTPEQYLEFAGQQQKLADHLNAEAQRLEDKGQFEAAKAKEAEANEALSMKARAEKEADQLRKNPSPTATQRAQKLEAGRKEWMTKAGIDFPRLQDQQTPEASALKAYVAQHPEVMNDPPRIYEVAKMVVAETAAARVPSLEKQLTDAQARIKELEGLTAPTPPGNPAKPPGEKKGEDRSESERFAELEQMAAAMGPLG